MALSSSCCVVANRPDGAAASMMVSLADGRVVHGRMLRPHSAPDPSHHEPVKQNAPDGLVPAAAYGTVPSQVALRTELLQLKRRLHRLAQPYATHFHWERKQCAEDEGRDRLGIAATVVVEHEWLLRNVLAASEAAWFRCLVAARQHDALLPWCSGRCSYCCMHRIHWAEHVTGAWTDMNAQLVQQEDACRRSLENGCMCELHSVHNFITSQGRFHQLLIAQAATVEAEWMHVVGILQLHQQRMYEALVSEKQALLTAWAHQSRAEDLAEREAVADQRCATAHAIMGRAIAQLMHGYRVQESEQRRQLMLRAGQEAVALSARMRNEHTLLMQSLWSTENAAMLDELQQLRLFKASTEAAQRKSEEDRVNAIKAEWVQEFQEIKRLKKAGPPKANQPLPPCGRCAQVPAKDAYTHRIQECTERPIACPKCADILPASQMDSHKEVCPQRVVPCATCGNFYKAHYVASEHSRQRCMQLQAFASVVADRSLQVRTLLLPTPSTRVGESDDGVPLLTWPHCWLFPPAEGAAANGPSASNDAWYALTHVDAAPVASMQDVEGALASAAPRQPPAQVPVTVVVVAPPTIGPSNNNNNAVHHGQHHISLTVGTRVQPQGAAINEHGAIPPCVVCASLSPASSPSVDAVTLLLHPIPVTVVVRPGAAVCCHHFSAMQEAVAKDASQYCKPQMDRKQGGKGGSAKPSK